MANEFDRHAAGYDEGLARALGSSGENERFAAYKVDEIADRLRGMSVARILDFGCGVGRSLGFLAERFPEAELFGFDPSAESISAARTRHSRAKLTANWTELAHQRFDCILMANVLHHVPPNQRLETLARCATVLSRNGHLFAFEHNPFNPATRWVFERCAFDAGAAMISRRDLEDLGARAGLRCARRAYTLFVPFRGRFWRVVQRPLSGVPLGAQYYLEWTRSEAPSE